MSAVGRGWASEVSRLVSWVGLGSGTFVRFILSSFWTRGCCLS